VIRFLYLKNFGIIFFGDLDKTICGRNEQVMGSKKERLLFGSKLIISEEALDIQTNR
jgi:hypothetical protein